MIQGQIMNTYPEPPVTFVEGRGTVLVDSQGKEYLDFLSGLAVTSLGHARKEVVDAIATQAGVLTHVSNLYGNLVRSEVAGIIDELLFEATRVHGKVFFCNSGAEANECALKLARRMNPGRFRIVTTTKSFHGRTLATLAATGQPEKHTPFTPMPEGFDLVEFGDLDAVTKLLSTGEIAGVLVEALQAEGGINTPPKGYLPALQQACRDHGALFMVDEVQSGLGRTGAWFAFQDEDLSPDVVTLAKSLGNGMPVGACWAKEHVADMFGVGDHGSTFGGQPLAMAAAKATLETLVAIDAPQKASHASSKLTKGLSNLSGVAKLRGRGLLLGAELNEANAKEVTLAALDHGLVVNAVAPNVVRFTPPLTVSDNEIGEAILRFGLALDEVAAKGSLS